MFTITKLSVEDGQDSAIGAGYQKILDTVVLFNRTWNHQEEVTDVKDVKAGFQLIGYSGLYNRMNTSEIKEIIDVGFDSVTFRTQTSVYMLEQHEEDE